MGIIKRQSIKSSFVSLTGSVIGTLSTIFVYYGPGEEFYGYAQFLLGISTLFIPLVSLGVSALVLKYYARFQADPKLKSGFLRFIFQKLFISGIIFIILFFLFRNYIFHFLKWMDIDVKGILPQNQIYFLLLSFLQIVIIILTQQASNLNRTVVPEILTNLSIKIALPIFVLCHLYLAISQATFAWLIIGLHVIIAIALIIYLYKLRGLSFSRISKGSISIELKKEMQSYTLFGSLNSLGSSLAFRLDAVMISSIIGFASNGFYSIILFISNIIDIPTRAINNIAAPIISKAWSENNLGEIRMIYQKSALNLLIIGIPLYLFFLFSITDIFGIMPNRDFPIVGYYVFLFLGLGKLIDMATSVNSSIIVFSDFYKINLIFVLSLGVLNFILNFWLITDYGILGAAIASTVAYFLYNLAKVVFLYLKFDLQPFTAKTMIVIGLGMGFFVLLYLLDGLFHGILSIILNGLVLALAFFPIIYLLRVSSDFNELATAIFLKIKYVMCKK